VAPPVINSKYDISLFYNKENLEETRRIPLSNHNKQPFVVYAGATDRRPATENPRVRSHEAAIHYHVQQRMRKSGSLAVPPMQSALASRSAESTPLNTARSVCESAGSVHSASVSVAVQTIAETSTQTDADVVVISRSHQIDSSSQTASIYQEAIGVQCEQPAADVQRQVASDNLKLEMDRLSEWAADLERREASLRATEGRFQQEQARRQHEWIQRYRQLLEAPSMVQIVHKDNASADSLPELSIVSGNDDEELEQMEQQLNAQHQRLVEKGFISSSATATTNPHVDNSETTNCVTTQSCADTSTPAAADAKAKKKSTIKQKKQAGSVVRKTAVPRVVVERKAVSSIKRTKDKLAGTDCPRHESSATNLTMEEPKVVMHEIMSETDDSRTDEPSDDDSFMQTFERSLQEVRKRSEEILQKAKLSVTQFEGKQSQPTSNVYKSMIGAHTWPTTPPRDDTSLLDDTVCNSSHDGDDGVSFQVSPSSVGGTPGFHRRRAPEYS
jgi:hypothetical protein